jgi:hypothetical protein
MIVTIRHRPRSASAGAFPAPNHLTSVALFSAFELGGG